MPWPSHHAVAGQSPPSLRPSGRNGRVANGWGARPAGAPDPTRTGFGRLGSSLVDCELRSTRSPWLCRAWLGAARASVGHTTRGSLKHAYLLHPVGSEMQSDSGTHLAPRCGAKQAPLSPDSADLGSQRRNGELRVLTKSRGEILVGSEVGQAKPSKLRPGGSAPDDRRSLQRRLPDPCVPYSRTPSRARDGSRAHQWQLLGNLAA